MRPARVPSHYFTSPRAWQFALLLGALGCDGGRHPAGPYAVATPPSAPRSSAQPLSNVHDAASELAKTGCPDDARGSVRTLDPTHCAVPRAVFFGDRDCLLSQPRLSPVSEAGHTIGFRQHDVPSHSVYALCGLRPGDVWLRVNGTSLDSPEAALAVYPSLRSQQVLRIDLQRDGKPIQLHIQLED